MARVRSTSVLLGPGDHKIRVIEALRDVTCDEPALAMLDLRSAKRLTDTAPCVALPQPAESTRPPRSRKSSSRPARPSSSGQLEGEMFHDIPEPVPRAWPS